MHAYNNFNIKIVEDNNEKIERSQECWCSNNEAV